MPSIIFDRQACVEHLYEGLPDKSFIHTSTRVDRVEHTERGIRVVTTDGRVEEGDLVIGADGVHSTIRQQMWDYAAKHEPGSIPECDQQVFSSEFAGLFGVSELTDDMGFLDSESNVVFGHDHTEMVFTQPGKTYWAVIFKDGYHKPPVKRDGSEEAMKAVAEKYRDVKLTPNLTLWDLWQKRSRAGLLNVEEGMLEKWHAGRFVLVGDSAHKMTADLGLGANIAIEGAVTLCNILNRETKSDKTRHFSQSELSNLFKEYQKARFLRAKAFTDLSGKATRANSYQTYFGRFMAAYLNPWMASIQLQKLSEAFAKGPKLDYVPTRTINEDADGWKLAEKSQNAAGSSSTRYVVAAASIGFALSFMFMRRLEVSF
ncbi:FAD-binding domain-containing protein 25 [Elsinoe fawcettii]|nr:FAD-binding domain-containing protein 25 [Elsinoe fawcettii]